MLKKILNVFLVVLSCLGVFMTVLYAYTTLTSKSLYEHSTSTYATSVVDPLTNETMSPFTVNYYSNYNNSGKEVVEFRINCYSDQRKTAIYSRGFQLVDDTLYYYDSFDGHSWESGHVYDETNDDGQQKTFFYIDVDNKICAVRLDGSYSYTYYEQNDLPVLRGMGNAVLNLVTFHWTQKSKVDYCKETVTKTGVHYYTYKELLQKIASIVKSSSYGTGSYKMPLIDLGDFLHLYEVADDGTVSDTPIGDGGLINSYFSMDINYDKRGMTYAKQSLFESVASNSEFNITGIDFDVNYWKVKQSYNLTENDFEERYSSIDGGFYYSLSSKIISELKNFENIEINISFDISKIKNKNVLGFDNYALYGIKVNSLTIFSSSNRSFSLLIGSLKDTGLTSSSIKTTNVTLNNISSGVEL